MAEGMILREQRNLQRRELIYYLKITDRRTGQVLGHLGDLHAEGMLIMSSKPLPVGAKYQAQLELPKTQQDKDFKSLDLILEILWSRPGPKASIYHENGARLLELDSSLAKHIEDLVFIFAMPGQQ